MKGKGGWGHIQIWVEWGPEGGTPHDGQQQMNEIIDKVDDLVVGWASTKRFDAVVSGSFNVDGPE